MQVSFAGMGIFFFFPATHSVLCLTTSLEIGACVCVCLYIRCTLQLLPALKARLPLATEPNGAGHSPVPGAAERQALHLASTFSASLQGCFSRKGGSCSPPKHPPIISPSPFSAPGLLLDFLPIAARLLLSGRASFLPFPFCPGWDTLPPPHSHTRTPGCRSGAAGPAVGSQRHPVCASRRWLSPPPIHPSPGLSRDGAGIELYRWRCVGEGQ